MGTLRIEVESLINVHDASLLAKAKEYYGLPIREIVEVRYYLLSSEVEDLALFIDKSGHQIFVDPIVDRLHFSDPLCDKLRNERCEHPDYVVEVGYLPGVTDNTGRSASEGLKLLGIDCEVFSGKAYYFYGAVKMNSLQRFARESMGNMMSNSIEVFEYDDYLQIDRFKQIEIPSFEVNRELEFMECSLDLDDNGLLKLSRERYLALSLEEMLHIKNYYLSEEVIRHREEKGLPKWPTDVELEVIAQTWSEHCKHKIFSAHIDYREGDLKGAVSLGSQKVSGLYSNYIKGATKAISDRRKIDWLKSVFSDNAGVVRFDDKIDLCIKLETHNSPSALDPYAGSITGILGVNRDILGTGMGGRPIANMDLFCFGPPHYPVAGDEDKMPLGLISPRRIFEEVHRGVEDGGNKSGIPTVAGGIHFDVDYCGKPLVFCGTIGAMPHHLPKLECSEQGSAGPAYKKYAKESDLIFMVGGSIGADGIHGATFSSMELDKSSPSSVVQIGDPLTQKRVVDFILEARDAGLFSSITDNGAGGLSSSVGEMALEIGGASIDLKKCPVKCMGLMPWEIMVSESQERMTVAVPRPMASAFIELAERRSVVVTDIGSFNDSKKLDIYYGDSLMASLDLNFLHKSLPPMKLSAVWDGPRPRNIWLERDDRVAEPAIADALKVLLGRDNIASKEHWVRMYDHEVQGATHIGPFVSSTLSSPSDGGVLWLYPHGGQKDGAIAVGFGIAPRISLQDPYLMAQWAVDEAVRNTVAMGADIDSLCLLDNFCWPDPILSEKNPDGDYKLGQLVRTCKGLYDICCTYGTPLVSGKDSMKNDFRGENKKGDLINISVLPTLLATAMGKAKMGYTQTGDFKKPGDLIYLLGPKGSGLLGSEYDEAFIVDKKFRTLPQISLEANYQLYKKLYKLSSSGTLESCHDVSDGGLLTALAESAFAHCLGMHLQLDASVGESVEFCFNEAPGRFVVSVSRENTDKFKEVMADGEYMLLGRVVEEARMKVLMQGKALVDCSVESLYKHWNKEWMQ